MTPTDFRTARKSLGLTQHGMAEALRMGRWGFQSVARWEKGEVPIPGPVQVAVELMVAKAQWVEIERMQLGITEHTPQSTPAHSQALTAAQGSTPPE